VGAPPRLVSMDGADSKSLPQPDAFEVCRFKTEDTMLKLVVLTSS
jgi:hypothetical protein